MTGAEIALELPRPSQTRRCVDVHAHFVPEFYRQAAQEAGYGKPDLMPGIPTWSLDRALNLMDRNDIEFSMLSISSPGIYFGDLQKAVTLARRTNECAAEIVAANSTRFGFFAILPLPDVEKSMQEIAYGTDALKADGFVIMSNQNGIYPGDFRFDAVFAELSRRKMPLFIHPTSPCTGCGSSANGLTLPMPMLEFMFESTRVVTNLILSGTTRRHKDLRIIIPHGGAALSVLTDRIAAMLAMMPGIAASTPEDVFDELRHIYFDSAGIVLPRLLPALLSLVGHSRLLYGSDWPHTPEPYVANLMNALEATDLLPEGHRGALWRGNACKLFPRLEHLGRPQ